VGVTDVAECVWLSESGLAEFRNFQNFRRIVETGCCVAVFAQKIFCIINYAVAEMSYGLQGLPTPQEVMGVRLPGEQIET